MKVEIKETNFVHIEPRYLGSKKEQIELHQHLKGEENHIDGT